jgi:hypothetical protein
MKQLKKNRELVEDSEYAISCYLFAICIKMVSFTKTAEKKQAPQITEYKKKGH